MGRALSRFCNLYIRMSQSPNTCLALRMWRPAPGARRRGAGVPGPGAGVPGPGAVVPGPGMGVPAPGAGVPASGAWVSGPGAYGPVCFAVLEISESLGK